MLTVSYVEKKNNEKEARNGPIKNYSWYLAKAKIMENNAIELTRQFHQKSITDKSTFDQNRLKLGRRSSAKWLFRF